MAEAIRRVYEIDVKASADAVRAIKQISTSAQGLEKQFASMRGAVSGFFSGLASVFTAGAFVGAIRGQIKAMDELGDASERAQVSVEVFSQLSHVFNIADASREELSVGLKFLGKTMNEVNDPASKAAKVMASLGIDLRGKPVEEQIRMLADAFVGVKDPAQRLGIALEFFGKGGQAWIPVLAKGGDEIDRLRKRADELGITLSTDTKNGVDQFDASMKESQGLIDGVFRAIAIGLLPTLRNMTGAFADSKTGMADWKIIGEGVGFVLKAAASATIILTGALKTVGQTIGSFLAIGDELQRFEFAKALNIVKEIDKNASATSASTTRAVAALWAVEQPLKAVEEITKKTTVNQKALKEALAGTTDRVDKQAAAAKKLAEAWAKSRADAEQEIRKLLGEEERRGQLEAQEEENKALERFRGVLSALEDPLRTAIALENERFRIIDEAIKAGFLRDPIEAENLRAEAMARTAEVMKNLRNEAKKTEDPFKDLKSAIENWGEETVDTMLDVAVNAKNLGEAFTDLVSSILRDLARIQLQKNIRPLMEGLSNVDWGSFFGGGGGTAGAKGLVLNNGALQPFARGGIVTQPTLFPMASGGAGLMGEAGFEAIMPLKRGSDGRLGVEGAGVIVNVNNYTSAEVSVQESEDGHGGTRLDLIIDQKIDASLARGKYDATLRSNFGITRRGF